MVCPFPVAVRPDWQFVQAVEAGKCPGVWPLIVNSPSGVGVEALPLESKYVFSKVGPLIRYVRWEARSTLIYLLGARPSVYSSVIYDTTRPGFSANSMLSPTGTVAINGASTLVTALVLFNGSIRGSAAGRYLLIAV